jgi:uncharacterized protein YdeI (YjbR/CyaY-like superfamily)
MLQSVGRRNFKARAAWRAWLAKNHATGREIWLVLYKKHTGTVCVSYEDAVEEALCFGWIDGLVKSIDDEKYAVRFSPRKSGSIWSETNKRRVAKMIEQERMTKIGLAKVEQAKRNGKWKNSRISEDTTLVPNELKRALRASEKAERSFGRTSPSLKRMFIFWFTSAKTDTTRQRRIRKVVRMLISNEKIGIDTRMGTRGI